MEFIVILVVLAAIVLAGVALGSYSPVGVASARVDAQISAPSLSGWLGLFFEVAFGLLVLVVFAAVLVKVVGSWLRRQGKPQGKWKSGPNANWGRTDEAPKMDTEKMLQLAMLSKLVSGEGGGPVVLQQPETPREPQQSHLPEGWW